MFRLLKVDTIFSYDPWGTYEENPDHCDTANHNYVKHFMLDLDSQHLRGVMSDRELGKKYGVEWAEAYHYIGPRTSNIKDHIRKISS